MSTTTLSSIRRNTAAASVVAVVNRPSSLGSFEAAAVAAAVNHTGTRHVTYGERQWASTQVNSVKTVKM